MQARMLMRESDRAACREWVQVGSRGTKGGGGGHTIVCYYQGSFDNKAKLFHFLCVSGQACESTCKQPPCCPGSLVTGFRHRTKPKLQQPPC
jgi:hypothetical protein